MLLLLWSRSASANHAPTSRLLNIILIIEQALSTNCTEFIWTRKIYMVSNVGRKPFNRWIVTSSRTASDHVGGNGLIYHLSAEMGRNMVLNYHLARYMV